MYLNRRLFLHRTALMTCAAGLIGSTQALGHCETKVSPAFHPHPPTSDLPPVQNPLQYASLPVVERVYRLAAKIRPVLYQLPCYCYCDQSSGHTSLLDCFVGTHGAECKTCQREVVFAFKATLRKMSPGTIRAALGRGNWRAENVDDVTKLPVV